MVLRLILLSSLWLILASHDDMPKSENAPTGILATWFGEQHYFLVHFPIALVVMTVIAEILFLTTKKETFNQASLFMLWGAAIAFIPTALAGYVLSSKFVFEGTPLQNTFWWHVFWGVFSMILCWSALLLKRWGRDPGMYYLILFMLFFSVLLTGNLGGNMAFG